MNRREFTISSTAAGLSWLLPSAVCAQSRTYRVAFITLDPGEHASVILGPLRDLGFVEGVNLTFIHRSAEGDPKRVRVLAEELGRGKPDVIVAGWGTLAPQAAKEATATIPIVLTSVGDPVG